MRDPLLPALRSRSVECLLVLLLAAVAVAAAALGPLYLRAVDQAAVQSSLRSAAAVQRDVTIDAASAGDARHYQLRGAATRLFDPPVVSRTLALVLPGFKSARFSGYLGSAIDRAGACRRLRIVAGRCFGPSPGEIVISAAALRSLHLRVGSSVRVDVVAGVGDQPIGRLAVVGTYAAPDPRDAYWAGDRFARTGLTVVDNGDLPAKLRVDPFFTGDPTLNVVTNLLTVNGVVGATPTRIRSTLRPERVDVDDVATLRAAVGSARARIAATHPVGSRESGALKTGLPQLLDDSDRARSAAGRIVPAFAAQLAVLLVVLIGTVIAGGVERRRRDLALARLRGRSRSAAARWAVADLGVVLLASLLPGWALAWLVDRLLIAATLPDYGIGPEWRWPVLAAGAAMVAVAGVILYGTASRAAREPLPDLMRTVSPPAGRRLPLGEVAVALIAVAGVVVVLTGGRDTALALVTPTLLALLAGLVLARAGAAIAVGVGRRAIRRRRIGLGLVALNAARSAGLRRAVALTCVAVALVVSTVDQWSVARTNRQARAEVEVGAPVVLTLGSTDLAGLRRVVSAVDPDGRYAMPVAVRRPAGTGFPVLAADATGLQAVAVWGRGNRPPASVLRRLIADHSPAPIRASGTTVQVAVSGVSVTTDPGVTPAPKPVSLTLIFRSPQGFLTETTVPLPTGPRAAQVTAPPLVGCTQGCTLTRLEIVRAFDDFSRAHIAISLRALRVGGRELPLGAARDWQDVDAAQAAARQAPGIAFTGPSGGLVLRSTNDGSARAVIQHLDSPVVPPCLVAGRPAAGESGANGLALQGLDGRAITCHPVGSLPFVPGLGARGIVLDLGAATGATNGSVDGATAMVFVRAGDPKRERSLRAALDRAVLPVAARRTVVAHRRGFDRTSPAQSMQVALAVAGAAAAVAALMVLVLAGSARRARRADLAALGLLGIRARLLRRTVLAEQLAVVLAGAAAGFGVGLAGARLAVDALPMFISPAAVPRVVYPTAWAAIGIALAAGVAVLAAAAGLAAVLLTRGSERAVGE